MCKLGDLIIIDEFKNENNEIVPRHTFVVINDKPDFIEGFKYDFISNMLCSFHDDEHKNRKLKSICNFPIKEKRISGKYINEKEGYIKTNQLYYFEKKKIKYKVFAHIDDELLDELLLLILELNEKNMLEPIYTNLK